MRTKILYLVACSGAKLPTIPGEARPAEELYQGDLFRKSMAYAEARVAQLPAGQGAWGILSAKFGCVHPRAQLEAYNQRLGEEPAAVYARKLRETWGELLERLAWKEEEIAEVVFLAGREYREAFCGAVGLRLSGVAFRAPLAGLGIGVQKQRLMRMLGEVQL